MPIFSLKCFRTDTQVARNRVRGFGLLKPHTVPARIVSPLSGAFSTLSAFQVESVEQPCRATTALARCRPAARLGSPPPRRAGFFKRLPFKLILGIVARARRELGKPQGAQRPPDCRLVNRELELLKKPARQVLAPPTDHAVDGREGTALHHASESPAVVLVQLGTVARRLAVDQAVGTMLVET